MKRAQWTHYLSAVIAGHSRSKNGVLSHAYDPAIHEAAPRRKIERKAIFRGHSSWMRGSSPRMTIERPRHSLTFVMPALVAGIHVLG